VIAIKEHSDVNIDNVTISQGAVIGDTVTHAVIDRGAHGLGKPSIV
jgi:hypothetical protein